jgi:sarcosine oxidase, subunit beta
MKKADVIIAGGGIIGCATAYYLARKGWDVLVIEKDEIGAGGSSRNGGGVRQSARDMREMPLALYSVRNMWPGLSEELGMDVEYAQKGNLRLGKTPAHMKRLEEIVQQGKSVGLALEVLTQEEVKEVCPYVSEEVIGAIFCPTDGHANPMLATLAYYKKAKDLGATFIAGEEVLEVSLEKSKASGVKTTKDTYKSDQVLLAAAYNSGLIAKSLGVYLPMQNILIEALITEELPPMFPQMLGTAPADFYGHQTKHGSFVFGGSTGLEPFLLEDKWNVTRSVTAPTLCRAILGYFPWMKDVNIIRTWAGFKDQMFDQIPVLSRIDEIPGLSMACGFTGHGFGIAPATGMLLAEIVADKETTLPMDAFRYDRFKPKG